MARRRERIRVDIPVTVTTVLDSIEAMAVDLTEFGAQISGAALAPGAPFQLDHEGYSVFAVVQWSEVDRMGVRFLYEMRDGPLFEALERARRGQRAPMAMRTTVAPTGGFGRRLN